MICGTCQIRKMLPWDAEGTKGGGVSHIVERKRAYCWTAMGKQNSGIRNESYSAC